MLDTLQTVKKFKQIYSTVQVWQAVLQFKILITVLFLHLDYNEVEGVRLRAGGRTYFGTNDWRIQGYTAYGFKDDRI
jgi:hypothetical protein